MRKLDLLTASRGALAALTQNATHPADIEAARTWLREALALIDANNGPGLVTVSRPLLQALINAADETRNDWQTGIDDGTYEADLQGATDTVARAIAAAENAMAAAPGTAT